MITPRPLASLPTTVLPWLSLRDHFVATVGAHAGQGHPLGPLLVLADATFAPRSRFPLHPHRDMEILSIVLEGTLSHHGDQAHGATLAARSAQLISARDGMVHAEGNDTDAPTRMLQVWFQPDTRGGEPTWSSRTFASPGRHLLAGGAGMPLGTDAQVWWVDVAAGQEETLSVARGRRGYLMALNAPVTVAVAGAPGAGSPVALGAGEGAVVENGAGELVVRSASGGAVLWVDLK